MKVLYDFKHQNETEARELKKKQKKSAKKEMRKAEDLEVIKLKNQRIVETLIVIRLLHV